jgi:hypothetical protein
VQDTSRETARRYYELLRQRSPAQRAVILSGLNASVRQLAEMAVRASDPLASEHEVKARVAARMFGSEVAARLFPDVSL